MPRALPVLFVHYGDAWIRGSERGLLDLLEQLRRDRFEPLLWCNGEPMAEAARGIGLRVWRSRFSVLFDWEPPRFDLRGWVAQVRQGLRLVRENRVALIHASSGAPTQWMLPVSRTARIPLVTQLHTVYGPRDRVSLGLTHVPLAVGITAPVIAGLIEDGMPAHRTRVIHYGENLERLGAGDARGLRRSLGFPEDALVLVSVGSLIERKGFDLLLQAMRQLVERHPHLRLIIVGEGPQRTHLERLSASLGLSSAVRFLGERGDVGAILRDAADIAVSAARAEAFGLTLIEAAAFGLPVVAPDVDGVPEAVQDGVTGLLVPRASVEGLAAAISRLVVDPTLRASLGAAGRRRVREHFTVERYAREFESVYDALLARPRSDFGWTRNWTSPRAALSFGVGAACRRLFGARKRDE